jgi:hypothetical protein
MSPGSSPSLDRRAPATQQSRGTPAETRARARGVMIRSADELGPAIKEAFGVDLPTYRDSGHDGRRPDAYSGPLADSRHFPEGRLTPLRRASQPNCLPILYPGGAATIGVRSRPFRTFSLPRRTGCAKRSTGIATWPPGHCTARKKPLALGPAVAGNLKNCRANGVMAESDGSEAPFA